MIFITLSVTAQINSGVGYMHGTNKKGDNSTKSEYDADKAPSKEKADTTVIIRKATPASEARKDRIEQAKTDKGIEPDTTIAATGAEENTEAASNTSTTDTYINTTNADCVSPAWRYAAVGFGLLSLLLILLLVIGRRKDEPRRA